MPLTSYICQTCGVQHAPSEHPPADCAICLDPRQYVGRQGQQWTTLQELRASHHVIFTPDERDERVVVVRTVPEFAIGQNAYILRTPKGNVMWDCQSLIDQGAIDYIQSIGGLKAIVISHPHFYDSCVEWSQALGNIPIYISAADKQWIMRPDPQRIVLWEGDTLSLLDGEVTVVRCGGHFDGSCVLIWHRGNNPCAFSADTVMVAADRHHVSFMWSYPNYVPLSPDAVRGVWIALRSFAFEEIFGIRGDPIREGGRRIVLESAKRYIKFEGYVGDAIEIEVA
ncbi:hypothetical protein BC938DRAFT_471848 [Jimgerdemannia flammicorona]|uniref:Metallo-beta-lactamase domain-containing protein n=1 Tax=Jimgerdemannia flammicorona TaxID=994334 RepID=A0A433Q793_9FUNG|nr:hypothetical protein BC938DRAFT_471848 [Jimgerdemannia flammicorona]RUS25646.1 hypothetical protein BC938DRAFT_471848 [Jimgerdemannia flammicorona]